MISLLELSRLCLVVATLAACTDYSALERRAHASGAQHLVGTWNARFELNRPIFGGEDGPLSTRKVLGQLAFVPNRWVSRTYPSIGSPSDYGTFDVDFRPFGFDPRPLGETPTAVAGWIGDDSVEMVLGDASTEIAVHMRGHMVVDSITGNWVVLISRTGGGGGRFYMVRQH